MRRTIATTALGLTLLGTAACADAKDSAAPGVPATSVSPSAAATVDAALIVDKATSCIAIRKLEKEINSQAEVLLPGLRSDDPAEVAAATEKSVTGIRESMATAREIADRSTDPEVKAAVARKVEEDARSLDILAGSDADADKAMNDIALHAGEDDSATMFAKLCGVSKYELTH